MEGVTCVVRFQSLLKCLEIFFPQTFLIILVLWTLLWLHFGKLLVFTEQYSWPLKWNSLLNPLSMSLKFSTYSSSWFIIPRSSSLNSWLLLSPSHCCLLIITIRRFTLKLNPLPKKKRKIPNCFSGNHDTRPAIEYEVLWYATAHYILLESLVRQTWAYRR